MAMKHLLRDSLLIAVAVVIFAYATALVLNLLTGATPSDEVPVQLELVVLLVLTVLGLGFVLWRSETSRSSS
ncbi:MAG: hypothetical protein A3K66_04605 [Euryarchaeota archaeon RBG_16_67_27]|nr:MAG: hypothetical protein A3K66_04605 [Euryarchaeota archaeon RBG_16_67_27]